MQTVPPLLGSLLTKSSLFLPVSWSGLLIICLTNWSANSLLRNSRPSAVWPSSPQVLISLSHSNPRCVLLHMYLTFPVLCSCFFIPVFQFILLHCLEFRHLPPHSILNVSCRIHLKYSYFLAIFIFLWNPVYNQMSVIMPSSEALCSNCCSYCTYFTQLCSILRKCVIKSFLYCKIKSSFKIWLVFILSLISYGAVFMIGIPYICKRLNFWTEKQPEGL